MDLKEIKTKRPWKRVMPEGYMGCISQDVASIPDDPMKYMIVTQSDFLREYYPSGHAINDPKKYPDIYREELVPKIGYNGEETGEMTRRYYIERVPRCSFPFQMVITLKQLVHLCGNDVQFDLMGEKGSKDEKAYEQFKEGWQMKKMGNALYELAKSVKITGDGAIAGYFDNGQFGWTSLSYKNGDTLYPHFDPITGKLNAFARSYSSFDEDGKEMTEWLEVWDETNLYRFKKNGEDYKTIKDRIYEIFNLSGYTLVYRKPHGFPFIPVVYKRDDDGPCWAFSQDSCDNYEMSFSQMKHNNQAYGEPILMFIGNEDSVDLQHDMNGTIKTISAESGADAKYLQAQSASESYMKQLEQEYKMIYEGSFAVIPPEVKSGDLPAAALKILYSPAVEKAMTDAEDYQEDVDALLNLFKYGYGIEMENTIGYSMLPVIAWIEPYVHVNTSAVVNDLATAVQNGFCSKETAAERAKFYTIEGEWDRIVKEMKEEDKMDLVVNDTATTTASEEE